MQVQVTSKNYSPRTGSTTMLKWIRSMKTKTTPSKLAITTSQTGIELSTSLSSAIKAINPWPRSLRLTLRPLQLCLLTPVKAPQSTGSPNLPLSLIRANVVHAGHSQQLLHLRSRTPSQTLRLASLNSQSSIFSIATLLITTAMEVWLPESSGNGWLLL